MTQTLVKKRDVWNVRRVTFVVFVRIVCFKTILGYINKLQANASTVTYVTTLLRERVLTQDICMFIQVRNLLYVIFVANYFLRNLGSIPILCILT